MLPGNLVVVADQNTPIPGGTGNFTQFAFGPTALARRDLAFRAQGDFGQVGIYNAVLQVGSLTIVKETNPPGGTGFGFEGTGFGIQGCGLEGSFTLDDQQFITCANLTPGSFTVQETNFPGYTLSDIDCVGASSFSETQDSVTVDLEVDEIVVCTFTNTQFFVLNPIFPALDDNINSISAEQAIPGGNVAFIWGKATGSTTIGGRVCNGLELGIKNPRILAIAPANEQGVATHIFYIPTFGDIEFQLQLQAIDINTCRESNVIPQIIRKDEAG